MIGLSCFLEVIKSSVQRPYNIKINGSNINGSTVDATQNNTISWSLSGDVSVSFQVQIYNNSDGTLAFDSGQVSSYAISYVLNANLGSITNGNQYKITVTVFNSTGQSATSYAQIFNTATTPTVTLLSIGTVASPNYSFSATYSQSQNESMVSWIAYLYDSSKILIGQSAIQTSATMEYTFVGFLSGENYYVEFQATSTSGLTGTTGLVEFFVQYSQPSVGLQLTATNNVDSATIDLSWSIIQIIGATDDSNLTYLSGGGVDLTDGKNVWFDNGFNIQDNFSCKIWLSSPVYNVNLLTFTGVNGVITLTLEDDGKFHLQKTLNGCSKVTHIFSKEIQNLYFSGAQPHGTLTNNYFCFIQQVNNDLNIIAQAI